MWNLTLKCLFCIFVSMKNMPNHKLCHEGSYMCICFVLPFEFTFTQTWNFYTGMNVMISSIKSLRVLKNSNYFTILPFYSFMHINWKRSYSGIIFSILLILTTQKSSVFVRFVYHQIASYICTPLLIHDFDFAYFFNVSVYLTFIFILLPRYDNHVN